MDRRSWPWKRKSSSKNSGALVPVAASANVSPANRSSRRNDDHGMSKFLADQAQEATLRCQEAEEKLRDVNAKLAAAQSELVEKENHVKQHAKVAEEAVTGWEKAEEETASTKLQLETLSRRKEELEGKVSQLDSALKESHRSSQRAKDDHERRMQEMVAKKNKECERIRAELEARVAEVGHRLLESTAESKVLVATLQEKMRSIAELSEARSKAEAEIGVLNIRLENMDKDNLSLQYEIQVLNKQLQIRNDEKDYCKREADAAHKQHLDGVKKIQVLEAECQRLRSLVRRKLPGPAAVAQMKQEVDSWGREERRRSFGSSKGGGGGGEYHGRLSGGNKDFQIQLLTERVLSMEEETKLLREVLAQKNNELQAAKSLASAQDLSEAASSCVRGGLKPRALAVGSMSESSVNDEGGASCADAWTSAMISELDQFKKDASKVDSSESPRIILAGDSKFQMMDDFAEMEQLTSSAAATKSEEELDQTPKLESGSSDRAAELEKLVSEKEEQLNAANRLCMEISSKLLATEKEFIALQAKNAANESSLIKLQEKLDLLLEAPALGDQKVAADDKESLKIHAALTENVQKVVCLVEALAHSVAAEHEDGHSLPSPSADSAVSSDVSSSDQSTSMANPSFEKLTTASNRLVEGKVSVIDFMSELSTVLTSIVSSDSGSEQGRCLRSLMRKESSGELLGADQHKMEKLERENTGLRTEAKKLSEELSRIKVEKELLHQSCERSKDELQEVESKLSIAERLVSEFKQQLTTCRSELSQCRASLEERIKVADSTVAELREKLEVVEGKFQAEQDQHRELEKRYEELEKQINLEHSCRGDGDRPDEDCANQNNGDEIAVKLAECQRTILALGKQLKVLSSDSDQQQQQQQHQEELSDIDESCIARNLQTSNNNTLRMEDEEDFSWSRIKLQGFEPDHLTLPWSPPRSVEELQPPPRKTNGRAEESDSTWLYSGDQAAAGYRRTVMRSPGRFVSKKSGAAASNELAKSVTIPHHPKNYHGGSSFARFFSRNSRNPS